MRGLQVQFFWLFWGMILGFLQIWGLLITSKLKNNQKMPGHSKGMKQLRNPL